MKRFLIIASVLALVLASESFVSAVYAHGGTYRGPTGNVPPTGRQPSDPTPAPAPNPGPTPGPGPAPGPTPAPAPNPGGATPAPSPGAAPTAPRPAGAGAGATTGARRAGGRQGPGFEAWEFWWQYNKDVLLNLKTKLYSTGTVSGSSDFFLGSDKNRSTAVDTVRPTQKIIDEEIVPVLKGALKDSQPDVRDSAVIALGKVGTRSDIPTIVESLKDDQRTVREAAVLALGILGDKEATETLIHVLRGTAEARKLRGGKDLETRLRAMAAVSLGLIGDERGIDPLVEALRLEKERVQDVPVCAAVGLGVMRSKDERVVSALGDVLKDHTRYDFLVRAHAANALGKIYQDKRGEVPAAAMGALEKALKDKDVVVRRSAVVALGLVSKPEDTVARVLVRTFEDDTDLTARYWAGIAMGQIGGDVYRRMLERMLAQRDQARAYAALALSLQVRGEPREVEANKKSMAQVLDVFREEKNPSISGALAIALGIAGHVDAKDSLKAALSSSSDPTFQGYACVGLGLMEARDAKDLIVEVLKSASAKPDLQREAAIGLGLMGMREVIPALLGILAPPDGKTPSTLTMGSITQALGFIGDRTAIPPLVTIAKNTQLPALSRGFAIVALGTIGEDQPIPVLSNVARDLNYRAMVETLQEVLDIL